MQATIPTDPVPPSQGKELFLSPSTYFAYNIQTGLIKNLETDEGLRVPGVVAEALSTLNQSGSAFTHLKAFWKSKSFLSRLIQTKDVLEFYSKEFKSIYLGKDAIAKMLLELVETYETKGYLLNREKFRRSLERPTSSSPSPMLFGLTTANRPQALDRCLRSYIGNFQRFGHSVRIVVSDDSLTEAMQNENRAIVDSVARDSSWTIDLVNRTHRETMINEETDLQKKKALRYLLLGIPGLGETYGLNRNALHFKSQGHIILSVDDDTLAHTFLPRDLRAGIEFENPLAQNLRHFVDRNDAISSLRNEPLDILASHRDFTGQSIRSLLSQTLETSSSEISGLKFLTWPLVLSEFPKVILSMNGLVGDSGSGPSLGFLYAKGEEENRFLKDLETGAKLSTSREITKIAAIHSIARQGPCMTTFYSYDNRDLLIPFFPHFRMEDSIFKTLNLAYQPHSRLAYLPFALEHSPVENRKIAEIVAPIDATISSHDILETVLELTGVSSSYLAALPANERKKRLLTTCLNFLESDFTFYRRILSEVIISKKFNMASQKRSLLQMRKRKLPRAVFEMLNGALVKTEELLSGPNPLADRALFAIEKDPKKVEELQRHMLIRFMRSSLELCDFKGNGI